MVNVLFCGNSGVFDGFLTCALSLMKRTESKEPFAFYIYEQIIYVCIVKMLLE